MKESKILIYDGSFNGFLTAVYYAFEEKVFVEEIQKNSVNQNGLFSETKIIFTNLEKAKRVWKGIQKKSNSAIKNIYFAYQGQSKGIELLLYKYVLKLFNYSNSNYSDEIFFKINYLAKNVGKEKLHLEAFLQFTKSRDEVLFANIEPEYDVLPLLSKHFRSQNSNRPWLIFDAKRKYGIYYDLEKVEIVSLDLQRIQADGTQNWNAFSTLDENYQEILNGYFINANLKSCINKKIHTPPVERQAWKSLSEKKEAV